MCIRDRFRPACPLVACTTDVTTWRQMSLIWGCLPVLIDEVKDDSEVFEIVTKKAMEYNVAKDGDTVVIPMGSPVGVSGATNTLRVEIVGDVISRGVGVGTRIVSGKAKVVKSLGEAEGNFMQGDILITTMTTNDLMPYIKKAAAIVRCV